MFAIKISTFNRFMRADARKKVASLISLCVLFLVCLFLSLKKFTWSEELHFKLLFRTPPRWMQDQISADLALCSVENLTSIALDRVMREDARRQSAYLLVRCSIKEGQVFMSACPREKDRIRYEAVHKSLRKLAKLGVVPNVDFVVSLADCVDGALFSAPIFAFVKNKNLREPIVLMPDFEALSGNAGLLKEAKKGIKAFPWKKKQAKAIWRGAMIGMDRFNLESFLALPRSQLVALSNAYPQWIDAKFSSITHCDDPEALRKAYPDYFDRCLPISDHLAYKFQILVDGNSCAHSRAYWQLFSNCVIFKQDSPNVQWYYRALTPYVHYIPVRSDFGDLIEKMRWAEAHDRNVRIISKNAREFASRNLTRADVNYYVALLLKAYAQKQRGFE